jgi:hypothetical protein
MTLVVQDFRATGWSQHETHLVSWVIHNNYTTVMHHSLLFKLRILSIDTLMIRTDFFVIYQQSSCPLSTEAKSSLKRKNNNNYKLWLKLERDDVDMSLSCRWQDDGNSWNLELLDSLECVLSEKVERRCRFYLRHVWA